MTRRWLTFSLLFVLLAGARPAAARDDRAALYEIEHLARAYVEAAAGGDARRLAELTAEDFRSYKRGRAAELRADWLKRFSPTRKEAILVERLDVQLLGDTAITIARVVGKDRRGAGLVTVVWQRRGRRWLAVSEIIGAADCPS